MQENLGDRPARYRLLDIFNATAVQSLAHARQVGGVEGDMVDTAFGAAAGQWGIAVTLGAQVNKTVIKLR